MTPYEAVYGCKVTGITPYLLGDSKVAAVDEVLCQRVSLMMQLKDNLKRAQQRMIQQADAHRKDTEFNEGDWVFVRLQPYRQTTVRNQCTTKLTRRYYGPFQVTRHIGKVAY
ncbi:unnamed protein product [Rhodiola kirilowii]